MRKRKKKKIAIGGFVIGGIILGLISWAFYAFLQDIFTWLASLAGITSSIVINGILVIFLSIILVFYGWGIKAIYKRVTK